MFERLGGREEKQMGQQKMSEEGSSREPATESRGLSHRGDTDGTRDQRRA